MLASLIVCLAAGVSSFATIYLLVDAIWLRALPYAEPQDLVLVWESHPKRGFTRTPSSLPNFLDLRRTSKSLDNLAAFRTAEMTMTLQNEVQLVPAMVVTGNLFAVLGRQPMIGRTSAGISSAAVLPEVVLSHRLWTQTFARRAEVVGTKLSLDGRLHTIAAVMPADFEFTPAMRLEVVGTNVSLKSPQLWVMVPERELTENRNVRNSFLVGRLRTGWSLTRAQSDLTSAASALKAIDQNANGTLELHAVPLTEEVFGSLRTPLAAALAAGVLILVAAMANALILLLARASDSMQDHATRSALGASPWALASVPASETLILAGIAGGISLPVVLQMVSFAGTAAPSYVPRLGTQSFSAYAAFAIVLVVVIAALIAALPAIRLALSATPGVVRQRGVLGSGKTRLAQRISVTLQMVVAVIALSTAMHLSRSASRLLTSDLGFDPMGVSAIDMIASRDAHPAAPSRVELVRVLRERLLGLPDVIGVAAVDRPPFGAATHIQTFSLESSETDSMERPRGILRSVSPEYFRVLSLRIVEGREFTDSDGSTSLPVAIVSREFARRYWPDGAVIGRRLKRGRPDGPAPWLTVVGVTASAKTVSLLEQPGSEVYIPMQQGEAPLAFSFLVRTRSGTTPSVTTVRQVNGAVAPGVGIAKISPLRAGIATSVAPALGAGRALQLLSVVALLLGGAGLYAVLRFWTKRNAAALAVRIALGAPRGALMRAMHTGILIPLIFGTVAGALIAVPTALALQRSLLLNASPVWPSVVTSGALLFMWAAGVSWLVQRDVHRIDVVALLKAVERR